jgi:O-antigen/teichoic acid export membrane protein
LNGAGETSDPEPPQPGRDATESGRPRPSFRSSAVQTYGRKLLVAFLSLANVLIVARTLGPAGRGEVVYLTTLALILAQLGSLSVQDANINFAGREPGLRRALASNSLVLAVLLGILAVVFTSGLIGFVPSLGGESGAGVRWFALGSVPVLILATYLERLLEADYRFTWENLAALLTPVAILTINGVLAVVGRLSVGTAVAAWVAGMLLGAVLRVWYVARGLGGFGRPDPGLARRSVGFGIKAHGARTLGWGNYRIDQLFVGTMAGPTELGLYSYAVTWAETLLYVPQTLVAVQRPDLVRATRSGAARQGARVYRVAVALSLPLALGLLVAAPFLCTSLAGGDFRGSIDDLRVLVAGVFGILALLLLGNALTAQSRPLLETAATAVAFLVTLALDILLIPDHGGIGAAIASSIAYTAGGVAAALLFARALGGRLRELVPRGDELAWMRAMARTVLRRPAAPGPPDSGPAGP